MKKERTILLLSIMLLITSLTLLGLIFPDHGAGQEANIQFSASSDTVWTVKKTINYHEWIVEDKQGNEFFLSVEGGFVPCFKVGTIISLHKK
jgi:hypothetical protein